MVIMDYKDLLTEVNIFLQMTLAEENLSAHAEKCRQQLITKLITQEGSPPQAYIDMNGGTCCQKKIQQRNSECYEEFDSPLGIIKYKECNIAGHVYNLYNNLSDTQKEKNILRTRRTHSLENDLNKIQSQHEDNMYINPSSPLFNKPVTHKSSLRVKTPSNSNSERNSIVSLKKDSDRTSDSSSYASNSTRCDESPEVVTMSASALRYAASRSGMLSRRERIFFMDHTKSCWVAVVNHILFIFNTDKDSKPLMEIDITGYFARAVAIPSNKGDFKFELVKPGNKTYQFIAGGQSDMEKWIEAINIAAKLGGTVQEVCRQLPLPPSSLEVYDQLDGVIRPVTEAEYDLPDTVLRSHTVSINSQKQVSKIGSPGPNRRNSAPSVTQPRQLPLLPQETYDIPDPEARPVQEIYECFREELYHSIEDQIQPISSQKPKEMLRRLPSLPQEQETYDQPEPTVRPVINFNDQSITQEEFYSMIDNDTKPVSQEAIYKNLESDLIKEDADNNYYNLVPSYPEKETDQECIYDVISEQRQIFKPSLTSATHKPPISAKPQLCNTQIDRNKPKTEEKRLSPFVSNIATIFNKPYTKPQLREVKTPLITKRFQ